MLETRLWVSVLGVPFQLDALVYYEPRTNGTYYVHQVLLRLPVHPEGSSRTTANVTPLFRDGESEARLHRHLKMEESKHADGS
jgi:hypothetical protein